MKYVDSAGRVEKFQKKYNWGKKKDTAEAATATEDETETEPAAVAEKE